LSVAVVVRACHVAESHVPGGCGLGAARRRCVASASAGHAPYDLARRDRSLGRLAHLSQGSVRRRDVDAVDGAILPAPEPPGRRRLALEAERDEGRLQEVILALDPEAAAVAPGAARVAAERIAHDANGRQARLDDFHRVVARGGAREDDHRRLAVEAWAGAGAARIQIALDEELARMRMRAERDRGHLVAI